MTTSAAAGISDVRRQDDAMYYVAMCMLHSASKSLKNSTEKNFGESGTGEEKL